MGASRRRICGGNDRRGDKPVPYDILFIFPNSFPTAIVSMPAG